ncbi:C4-dicarboxylate transport transcriptional regulatory protein [Acidisarcina polymorpha]|uniref:C4-dicarboxylate transport transcriptional regulatory protein n=1 Tax=Acidisarcina polymorpha TaxID=2211140 RepID=A0A2Z5FYX0_9BACT|nr:C4-dicarboxylate transport transcriptional regulatory protein [Acidisarcina polymorpha]
MNILLVDDDAIQASTRQAILERAGLSVDVATNGRDALSFVQSPDGYSVSLVITDHLMPVMNGPEFVRSLRESGYKFPVVVLSGYADAEESYDSLEVVFRVKPFPPDQLIALAQYLVGNSERRTA